MSQSEIDTFTELVNIADRLMGPGGCPWDREQTIVSIRGAILEEACEVLDAIDDEDDENLAEELGDLFYLVLFFCRIGEKEKRFDLTEALNIIKEKLIFRHPHVFGEESVSDSAEVLKRWEELKAQEKAHRESVLDGVPKALPALARAHKMAGKMAKSHYKEKSQSLTDFETEQELGALLWEVAKKAKERGFNAESALRKELSGHEKAFREWEKGKSV